MDILSLVFAISIIVILLMVLDNQSNVLKTKKQMLDIYKAINDYQKLLEQVMNILKEEHLKSRTGKA